MDHRTRDLAGHARIFYLDKIILTLHLNLHEGRYRKEYALKTCPRPGRRVTLGLKILLKTAMKIIAWPMQSIVFKGF